MEITHASVDPLISASMRANRGSTFLIPGMVAHSGVHPEDEGLQDSRRLRVIAHGMPNESGPITLGKQAEYPLVICGQNEMVNAMVSAAVMDHRPQHLRHVPLIRSTLKRLSITEHISVDKCR